MSPQVSLASWEPNGAGKTTLMKVVATLLDLDFGSVEMNGLSFMTLPLFTAIIMAVKHEHESSLLKKRFPEADRALFSAITILEQGDDSSNSETSFTRNCCLT